MWEDGTSMRLVAMGLEKEVDSKEIYQLELIGLVIVYI